MTTPTTKKVSRVTVGSFTSNLIGHKPRKIVVTIAGDTLVLRLQRTTKDVEYLSIKEAFEIARSIRVRSQRMVKLNMKRRAK
jgi:hypothetical protein